MALQENGAARELSDRIRARFPLISVVSHEETRIEAALAQVAGNRQMTLVRWTVSQGFSTGLEGESDGMTDPIDALRRVLHFGQSSAPPRALYVLKDFHPYMEDPTIRRWLRDIAVALRAAERGQERTVVILSPVLRLPPELERDVAVIDWPLPTREQLGTQLDALATSVPADRRPGLFNAQPREQIVEAALGLTSTEAEDVFALSLVKRGGFDLNVIGEAKKEIIRKSGLLEFYDAKYTLDDVGGLDALKRWLQVRKRSFGTEAKAFGLEPPRGALCLGVPGTGKSLIAKVVPSILEIPLLKLDVGRLFGSLVGQSEEQTRAALKVIDSVAPCACWLEEIDKAFAGTASSGDSGTAARVFGTFLTWMQERDNAERPVFLIATANSVRLLPPELLRKGRFSEIFFIDLPSPRERAEILAVHLRRRRRDPAAFEIRQVIESTGGFSGAELECVVTDGLHMAFDEGRALATTDLVHAATATVPLSTMMKEEIEGLREWARHRARPASTPEDKPGGGAGPRFIDLTGGGPS